jgi:sulfite reductase (NADPH) flavoprotein alpha-component
MVGPGTGVAPFRAFVQERQATGARGRNWLFFGDRHFTTDFLYQRDWQQYLKDEILTRMDVAFSRDQAHKIYVQHRMREQSRDIYAWMQEGAEIFICGDKGKMAADVQQELQSILQREGGMSPDTATAYLSDMKKSHRLKLDVY